jgi:hypothetical protein
MTGNWKETRFAALRSGRSSAPSSEGDFVIGKKIGATIEAVQLMQAGEEAK